LQMSRVSRPVRARTHLECIVRKARPIDLQRIWTFGKRHREFAVSKAIRFYEKKELMEWIRNPTNNIVLLAELTSGKLIGFLYCKIMSCHWAVVDNLLVDRGFRRKSIATKLVRVCESLLLERHIDYVSLSAHCFDRGTHRFLRGQGFKPTRRFIWMEKFL